MTTVHKLVQNPNSQKLAFKEKFIERYSKLTDWNTFKTYCEAYLRKSIRVNTLKIKIPDLIKRMPNWSFEQVPWCKEGFWIVHNEGRRDIGNTPEHALGYIYVQESASMIPPVVLDPKLGEIVLDMCAAPGSKTTQIGQYMENKGVLIANDITGTRLSSLGINIQRIGLQNIIVTQTQGQKMKGQEFDKILVDAPCSGTGTIRKSLKTVSWWNPKMIIHISKTQNRLIQSAFNLLKEGGTMVYSTCSLEPHENEAVVSRFLNNNPNAVLEDINLDINRSNPVTEFEGEAYNPEVRKCLRIWPQDNDTEGFFVAKIKKLKKKGN